jgi:hypothetical protein
MKKLFDTDFLAGEIIESISIEVWDQKNNGLDWITRVFVKTIKGILVISVNPNFDDLDFETLTTASYPEPLDKESGIISVEVLEPFSNLLNKKVVWTWTLTNNQGYQDGLQIEVGDGGNTELIQLMAKGSQIEVYKLKEKKTLRQQGI